MDFTTLMPVIQRYSESPRRENSRRVLPLCLLGLIVILGATGCQTFGPKFTGLRKDRGDGASIAGVQGPEERAVRNATQQRIRRDVSELESTQLGKEFAELEAAQRLYDDGRYAQADEAFQRIAEKHGRSKWDVRNLGRRKQVSALAEFDPEGNPIEEDAIFMRGQSLFKQGRFSDAEEQYAFLLKKYPNTRHLDVTTRQLFRISREWLGFPDAEDTELVRLAYGNNPPSLAQRRNGASGFPKFGDKSRPAFDPKGRALESLRLIWLHDASGDLADDALMMAANYYVQQENPVEAAQHYRLLREQFPDSPHTKDALLIGSKVALATYNGPGYDPTPLNESRQLTLAALQYPDLEPGERKSLENALESFKEAEVEPYWTEVQFYLTKKQPESAILTCNYIINKYPNSKFARRAYGVIDQLVASGSVPRNSPLVQAPPVSKQTEESSRGRQTTPSDNRAANTPPPRKSSEPRRLLDSLFGRDGKAEPKPIELPELPAESATPPGRASL
ncbi:MAG: tetratricopeptide repeat protein [Planctomycetaceae bacterium]